MPQAPILSCSSAKSRHLSPVVASPSGLGLVLVVVAKLVKSSHMGVDALSMLHVDVVRRQVRQTVEYNTITWGGNGPRFKYFFTIRLNS
jgi:hypothetical protein